MTESQITALKILHAFKQNYETHLLNGQRFIDIPKIVGEASFVEVVDEARSQGEISLPQVDVLFDQANTLPTAYTDPQEPTWQGLRHWDVDSDTGLGRLTEIF